MKLKNKIKPTVFYYLISVNADADTEISKWPLNSSNWRRSSDFIVNFEHIPHLGVMFLLLTLNR